jgi:hypothetical protein
MLEEESGYLYEPQVVALFRQVVLDGKWKTAETLLPEIELSSADNFQVKR